MFKEYFQRNKKVRFRAQKLITLCTFCNNEGTVFIFFWNGRRDAAVIIIALRNWVKAMFIQALGQA